MDLDTLLAESVKLDAALTSSMTAGDAVAVLALALARLCEKSGHSLVGAMALANMAMVEPPECGT